MNMFSAKTKELALYLNSILIYDDVDAFKQTNVLRDGDNESVWRNGR